MVGRRLPARLRRDRRRCGAARRRLAGPHFQHLPEHQQRGLEIARRRWCETSASAAGAVWAAARRGSNSTPERTKACFTPVAVRARRAGTRKARRSFAAARTGAGNMFAACATTCSTSANNGANPLWRRGDAHRFTDRLLGRQRAHDRRLDRTRRANRWRIARDRGFSRNFGRYAGWRRCGRTRDDHRFADRMPAGEAGRTALARRCRGGASE